MTGTYLAVLSLFRYVDLSYAAFKIRNLYRYIFITICLKMLSRFRLIRRNC